MKNNNSCVGFSGKNSQQNNENEKLIEYFKMEYEKNIKELH
jgi:hypothetical protein